MNLLEHLRERMKFFTDQRYRDFYLQRAITDITARERKADSRAASLPKSDIVLTDLDRQRSKTLQADGYVMLDDVLPPEWLRDLRAHLAKQPCSDPYRPSLPEFVGSENAPAGTHVAFFSNEVVASAPHVFEIANHPGVLGPVSAMLGAKPTASYMAAWWSIPAHDGTAQHAEKYHRDVDDLRFVKLFCYLTDVDEESGPHVFVPGSHRRNEMTRIRRYEEAEIYSAFGPDCEKRFIASAGTAFLENTYGMHRGFPAKSKARMIFQVLFSQVPVIYGPKEPVATIGRNGVPANIDPYINRVYCRPAN